MENYVKVGEISIVRGEDEYKVLEPLKKAGFMLCLIDADGFKTCWLVMKKFQ